jgi:protein-disulfide isomerase
VLVVVVGVAIVLGRDGGSSGGGTTSSGSGGGAAQSDIPATRQADGSIALAKAGVTHPVLELYEDFQCPVCKSFEDSSGSAIRDLVREGKVKVVYRPFRLFEQEPLKSNSERAANAAACAPADHWLALHDLLFQNQPAEGSEGFSTTDLEQWGRQAGVTDASFASCVAGNQKAAAVESATSAALASGVRGTPTGRLDGTDLSTTKLFDPDSLRAAITGGTGGGGSGGAGQPSTA